MASEDDNTDLTSGGLLKEIRSGLRLTQEELADKLDYSRATVANAERDREISQAYLDRFAERFPQVAGRLASVSPTAKPRGVLSHAPLGDAALDDVFFRRSSKTTDLDGEWFALWETTADHREVLNSERLLFKMKRDGSLLIQNVAISEENEQGGYLWIAQTRLFDNQYILGTYIPREPNVRSKGCLYLLIHASGRFISGQWIGCNYDGDWSRGLVVMARTDSVLVDLLKKHRDQIPSMPYSREIDESKESKNGR